jgi:RP/EB family microtubule-associated protein
MISANSSRADIIAWLNKLLSTKINKIEELGAGNVYCQLLDAAYPDKVPLQKVKWNAYLEIDFLHNFKILQTSFEKLGIKKYIEVSNRKCRFKS